MVGLFTETKMSQSDSQCIYLGDEMPCLSFINIEVSPFSPQLFLFNFYPFVQRFLQPHQRGNVPVCLILGCDLISGKSILASLRTDSVVCFI